MVVEPVTTTNAK